MLFFTVAQIAAPWTWLYVPTARLWALSISAPEFGQGRTVREEQDCPQCPALRLVGGSLRVNWPVEPGSRMFAVKCKHRGQTPTPRVRVERAPELGVGSDVTVSASSSTAWQQLQISVAVSAPGVLTVWLENMGPSFEVLWDDIEVV